MTLREGSAAPTGQERAESVGTLRPTGSGPSSREPWERYGWVMGAVWLIFLAFPLVAVFTEVGPVALRVLGVVLLAGFAAVYVHGLVVLGRLDTWEGVHRSGVQHLGVMLACALALAMLIGIDALGVGPFLVSLAMFTLPLRRALYLVGTCLLVALGSGLLVGEPAAGAMFAGIITVVSVAVLTVRLVDERQSEHRQATEEQALADERDRVARDVHDVLGHSLTVVTVKAELAERLIDLDPERAKAELADIRSMSRQALAEIRATVAGLRVARLTEELDSARNALTGAGIAFDLPTDLTVVDPRHRIILAWSLRELVTNVVRHSQAEHCTVTWGEDWLSVTDDGVGMGKSKEGNGIRGLRERARMAGGDVDAAPGQGGRGTCVTVQL